jgi:hypothetical protein
MNSRETEGGPSDPPASTDVRLLLAIKGALTRINHGTYGACAVCKQPISKARLDAVPWTISVGSYRLHSGLDRGYWATYRQCLLNFLLVLRF